MRKYKPVELPLRAVPNEFAEQRGVCPNCLNRDGVVIGRLGLRLVFRCERCKVRFHRHAQPTPLVRLV